MEKVDDGCYPRLFLKTSSAGTFPAAREESHMLKAGEGFNGLRNLIDAFLYTFSLEKRKFPRILTGPAASSSSS
jgi:hypothetical protein